MGTRVNIQQIEQLANTRTKSSRKRNNFYVFISLVLVMLKGSISSDCRAKEYFSLSLNIFLTLST
jgi:hypothetical protein